MTKSQAGDGTYRLVLRGELSDRFRFLFEGMEMERLVGTTVLTGTVVDQAHLLGLIEQAQELGIDLVSVEPVDQGTGRTALGLGTADEGAPPPARHSEQPGATNKPQTSKQLKEAPRERR
jgi:hypothetical protein